ncbi:hypothetical protein F5Y05DRAFT_339681 [Hypoxylon sp. FL0543]|nr:hypothetical protein F5Y05DRAFT_339681 [Hypoxylon sp. FL0543]
MANLGPLTTTYTPSGTGCQSIHIGSITGLTWIQQGTISDCFPSSFQPQDGYYYSPGICMEGYNYACEVAVGGGSSSITAATCCPSGFACAKARASGDPNACIATLTSDSSYVLDVMTYVTGSPTKLSSTAVLKRSGDLVFAKGLVVWRAPSDAAWPNSGSVSSTTTINTLSTPTSTSASTPIATASIPAATSTNSPVQNTASAETLSPSPSTENTSGLSVGAKAGIGIGVAFGSLLLLGAIAAAYLVGRRKGRATQGDPALIHDAGEGSMMSKMPPSYELEEQRRTMEMSAHREPAELMSSYP